MVNNLLKIRWIEIFMAVCLSSTGFAQSRKASPKPTPAATPSATEDALPARASAAECPVALRLSQKDVAERILRDGRRTKEINLSYQQNRLDLARGLAVFDWRFLANSGYRSDKQVGLVPSPWNERENFVTDVTLSKSLLTGTTATVTYARNSFQGESNTLYNPQLGPTTGTVDYFGIKLAQDLWANFFGKATRATWDATRLGYEAISLQRTNELENLVLDTIQLFWTTYVSEQKFRDRIASRERSRRLTDSVRRKSGFGYANPGELAQAQADYEARVIDVKFASNEYLANLDRLNTALGQPSNCEIQFVVSDIIPPIPQLPEKRVEDLRTFRTNKMQVEVAQRAYDAASSNDGPRVQLVGEYFTYGTDREASGAYSDLASGAHPQYYAGIHVEYNFGSNILGETRLNQRYRKEAAEVAFSRLTQESQNALAQAERNVHITYAALLSSIEQRRHRERALQEMSRSFTQGRTEISIYIEAMNKLSEAEIRNRTATGDYQFALNNWAAIRDELIPEAQEEK